MISVLVADDSIFIRKRMSRILDSDRRIKVVGTASNGFEVLEKIEKLKPDVITLDVEMPMMNGLEALSRITGKYKIPVVMLSALTTQGAEVTLQALEMGAFDFIAKPRGADKNEIRKFTRELILKVRTAALSARNGKSLKTRKKKKTPVRERGTKYRVMDPTKLAVVIGISTGGPKTLLSVIPKISSNFPGTIFIAQHMPAGFTASLANRLNGLSNIQVKEAKNGEVARPSTCYIAPGGRHMRVSHVSLSKGVMIRVGDHPHNALYKPSVDVLMVSVAEVYGANAIGIVMTGMGRDGTKGIYEIKKRGGLAISEDSSTCVVYGMPKSVEEAGYSDYVVPADSIPETIMSLTGSQFGR